MLQYALGVETVLLVALFAFYARISRQAAQAGLDADEVRKLPVLLMPAGACHFLHAMSVRWREVRQVQVTQRSCCNSI